MSILLGILTFVLIIVSFVLVLVVLAQKSKDGGMGAALGGGAAEAAFGADTANVLTRITKYAAILFFLLAFALYLGRIYERKTAGLSSGNALPTIAAPAAVPVPAPVAPVTTTTAPATTGEATAPAVTVPSSTPAATTPTPAPEQPKK
ncbi:MAG: preprotein translocase subunit SecG [Verrucomicrobiota bacterium]